MNTDSPSKEYSYKQWREDIEYLRDKIKLKHPDPYIKLSREAFHDQFQTLIEEVPSLSDENIRLKLIKCISNIGDMHTTILMKQSGPLFPLILNKFGKDFRIIKSSEELQDILGSRMLKINDRDINEIFEDIRELIPAENDIYRDSKALECLICPEILNITGLHSMWNMIFEFMTIEDKYIIKELSPMTNNSLKCLKGLIRGYKNLPSPPEGGSRFLPYWSSYLNDIKVLYVKYSACFDGPFAREWGFPNWNEFLPFDDFIEGIVHSINTKRADKFVLDLRGNVGGNIEFTERLFNSLNNRTDWKKYLDSRDRFFIITDNRIYSCGVATCIYLKSYTNGTFVGEATGGNVRIFSVTPNDTFYLPNTKIQAACSSAETRLCKTNITGNFHPDIEIERSFDDYLNGKDGFFDYVISKL